MPQSMKWSFNLFKESTGTFLLFLTGNDGLTTLFFFLIDAMIIFYFSYVAFFTYCKMYRPQILADGESTFKTINQVLNIFFTGYWWVFFTPLIEINSGMMVFIIDKWRLWVEILFLMNIGRLPLTVVNHYGRY